MDFINQIVGKFKWSHFTDPTFLYDNFLFSASPLLMLFVASFGHKVWIKFEIVWSLITGLVLIFRPQCFLSFMVTLGKIINRLNVYSVYYLTPNYS